jgi:hypothetical protein
MQKRKKIRTVFIDIVSDDKLNFINWLNLNLKIITLMVGKSKSFIINIKIIIELKPLEYHFPLVEYIS